MHDVVPAEKSFTEVTSPLGSGTSGVQVRPLLPAPRRNGLRSIQKAQPKGWAFLIPLRHSSFSPRNFASQIFAGALAALPGGKRASCVSLAAAYFKPPTRSLRCGSFSPQNFAAQTFVGAPAAPRAAYRLCSIQKARPVGRAFLISLHHSISAQEPPLTRRLASKRACGRSPSPRGILLAQTFVGNLSVRSALASPAMEYRDYQRNHEHNCYLHCFSSYRSFVFILSSSSFSCFSD